MIDLSIFIVDEAELIDVRVWHFKRCVHNVGSIVEKKWSGGVVIVTVIENVFLEQALHALTAVTIVTVDDVVVPHA